MVNTFLQGNLVRLYNLFSCSMASKKQKEKKEKCPENLGKDVSKK